MKKSKKYQCHVCGKKTMPAIGNNYCSNLHCSLYHLNLCKPEHNFLKNMWWNKGWQSGLKEMKRQILLMFLENDKKAKWKNRNPFALARQLQEIIDKLNK